jgi:hypothetical protein
MTLAHLFSPVARILTVVLCLAPPAAAWIAEIGIAHRLLRRMERSPGIFTTSTPAERPVDGQRA